MIVESYTPQAKPSVFNRLIYGVGNEILTPLNRSWPVDASLLNLMSGWMAGLKFSELNRGQRQSLSRFFERSMYLNRYGDLCARRFPNTKGSLQAIELFLNLPADINQWHKSAHQAGYEEEVIRYALDWFTINRFVNYSLRQLALCQPIDKVCYYNGSSEEGAIGVDPKREKYIEQILFESMSPWQEKGVTEQSILLRAVSSFGFAHSLLALACNAPIDESRRWLLKRMGSMIMITQIIDDFSTPVKDKKYEIAGIVSTVINTSPEDGCLHITPDESEAAVSLARQLMGACLDTLEIDPKPYKKEIIRLGLLTLTAVAYLGMRKKYGGSFYPIKPTIGTVYNELRDNSHQYKNIRAITYQALESSRELMLNLVEDMVP